jgi:hypothetical protein
LLSRAGAEVLGFVANGIDVKNEHDDYVSMTRGRFDLTHDDDRVLSGRQSKGNSISVP